ncbi:hypothetical protein PZA11_007660 [Diplocarpon coronariae]|uniref:Fucose-specific lectin FleA n=1 Tax=Diplocarpon coronariae TaxID=2795749 RepID=A0A218ZC67_9HELO|nr:fucose-specific lectin FleA [Marssonina coronariae]
MPSSFSHAPAAQVASLSTGTARSAVYKSTTIEAAIKVFFQDVLSGIRLISHDNVWKGGSSITAPARPVNKLPELCYDTQIHGSAWYDGAFSEKNIEVAPYSQVAVVYLTDSEDHRVYDQLPNGTIQEYSIDRMPLPVKQ